MESNILKARRGRRLFLFMLTLTAFLLALFVKTNITDSARHFLFKKVGYNIKIVLGTLSSAFKYSVFEAVVIISPVLIFLLIYIVAFAENASLAKRNFRRFLTCVLILANVYILTLGYGYNIPVQESESITEKYLIEKDSVTKQMLYDTVVSLKLCEEETVFDMSFDLPEYRKLFSDEYKNVSGKGENIFVPGVKPIELSKAASYMGIFSLYSFASGEILVNTNLPDFLYPFTVFHEYVHFSGVMREGEANFIAFLTCYNSDIPALRYSGILNAKIYLLSAISKIDLDLYKEALKTLTAREMEDIRLYSEYISEYDTPFGESVSDINGLHQSVYDKDKVHTYAQFTVFLVGYLTKGV